MFKIKKSQVLDHAKEKNIYIDPSTLTEKQKKDAKFMETVNTELTAAVVAKALQSLIATLVVKARIVSVISLRKRKITLTLLPTTRGNTMSCMSSKISLTPKTNLKK
jgi:hypothetical protein